MSFLDSLRRSIYGQAPESAFARNWTSEGVEVSFARHLTQASVDALQAAVDGTNPEEVILVAYLTQLVQAGRVALHLDRALLPWSQVYTLLEDEEHRASLALFELPPLVKLRPILDSVSTLVDPDFKVEIVGWVNPETGNEVIADFVCLAVVRIDGEERLLPSVAWKLAQGTSEMRLAPNRTRRDNELAWGTLRLLADQLGAFYRTPYLQTTYVLTPQTLRLPVKRENTSFGRVLTVEPTFDGAPTGWLRAFDGFNSVQDHYDLVSADGGHVRVVLSEPVRQVLQVIRREMPGRRVAGSRAEQFLHNPWAFLGEGSETIVSESDFERDRAGGAAQESRFAVVPRINQGRIERVDLTVQEHFEGGYARTTSRPFAQSLELEAFLAELRRALSEERQIFAWEEYDLDLDAEAARKLALGEQTLRLWRSQPADTIDFEDIFEMASYSGRVEGIGAARAVYVPVLQKPQREGEEGGWLPAEATPMVRVTLEGHPEPVLIQVSKEWVGHFDEQVRKAETSGETEVSNQSLPTAVSTPHARTLVDSFKAMLGVTDWVKKDQTGDSEKQKRERKKTEVLLVKTNLVGMDYLEERRARLTLPSDSKVRLPSSLRKSITLKKHQVNGIAWFQHLVSLAPIECRGALLADDMGLGKTIQLLSLIGRYYEEQPTAVPSIVIAPKTLVDNWAAEVTKFFDSSFPKVLILYGEKLGELRQPIGLIDDRLRDRGIVELLKPNWTGDAKVIITTYETLKRYEFSLARQAFAFVICDEAQRIKTPGTQVSLSVRALKADFRVACTGTPVENTLADLWCLFDFIQPGLLGALEEFSRTYRRPIECTTDEQRSALDRLQATIQPQTLRRTKLEIAHELKKKLFVVSGTQAGRLEHRERPAEHERLQVPMSMHQMVLYKAGLNKLQQATTEHDTRKRARLSFGALHLIKAVCAEPYCLPGMKFKPASEGLDKHLENSPKLAWLLKQLTIVSAAGEKAIVFTELREVQSALYYFLGARFGLKPRIINGDTQSRQRYIDEFSLSSGFNVILLSTLAAGAGLNITAANHVFHFTRAWNPAKENQATDRAFRIGQERDVYVYCPVSVTPDFVTFDVRLDELLRRKARLSDATLGGSAMESMLNGVGSEVSITELVGDAIAGEKAPAHYLTIDEVDRMDGLRFEVLCEMLWTKTGHQARVTGKKRGDCGIDVVALKGSIGDLLQCKCSVNDQVGWDAVKEVVAGAPVYQAMMPNVKLRRVAVTNQHFSESTRHRAEANQVNLVERDAIESFLAQFPLTSDEFEARAMEVAMCYEAA